MSEQPLTLRGWPIPAKDSPDASRDRFRHNLSHLMAERRITQASLARMMNVSRVAVHAWIWGTCFPETSRLIRLAGALGVPVGVLLEGQGASGVDGTTEETLLLNAFRKLPNTARMTLLAGAYELSAQIAAQGQQHDGVALPPV